MDITLETVNKQLLAISEELDKAMPIAIQTELEYEKRKADLLIHSGMGTAVLKEAETRGILIGEGLEKKHLEAKSTIRGLLTKRDVYLEVARNLRAIQVGKDKKYE